MIPTLDNGLAAAKTGALQRAVLNERDRLLRFFVARGLGDDAEDAFHDLWQRFANAPAKPVSNPTAYLFRAADNLVLDRHRTSMSRGRRHREWHEANIPVQEEAYSELALIARERLRAVEATLAAQGPRVALVFRRHRLDEISQLAIARELGISLSSVEKDLTRAYRALAALKSQFDTE